MVNTYDFKDLVIGDVFYRSNIRYAIESIAHRELIQNYPWGTQVIPVATVRTMTKKNTRRRGQNIILTGYVNFMELRPQTIDRIVKKDKVRGTRAYKSRKDYPFERVTDRTPLEASETNDCTVRALSAMFDMPYDEAHAFMKANGRKDRNGFASAPAYALKGLRYTQNTNGYSFGGLLKSGILSDRAIVRTNAHVVAIVNGVVHDTGKIGKNSKVYGWYTK